MTGRIFLGVYLTLFAGLLALLLVFNFSETASFTWWPGHRLEAVPLVYLIIGGVVLGAAYTSLVALLEQARLKLVIRGLRGQLARKHKQPAAAPPPEPELMDRPSGAVPEDARPWSR